LRSPRLFEILTYIQASWKKNESNLWYGPPWSCIHRSGYEDCKKFFDLDTRKLGDDQFQRSMVDSGDEG